MEKRYRWKKSAGQRKMQAEERCQLKNNKDGKEVPAKEKCRWKNRIGKSEREQAENGKTVSCSCGKIG